MSLDRADPRHARRFMVQAWGASLGDHPKRILELVPEWDDAAEYTPDQLLIQAERILCSDPKSLTEEPQVLRWSHLKERKRREIYTEKGTPDPSVCSGLYFRSHPRGRKVNTPNGARSSG